jgi:hypothetical protein
MRRIRVVALLAFTALQAASAVSAELLSETKLRALDAMPYDYFGESVSIDADTVVVGAPGVDAAGANSGAAYIFERNQGGLANWGEAKKLTASDAAAGDQFGAAVAISGDTIVVGAWGDGEPGLELGAAYIFERNQGGPGNWGQVKKLTASGAQDGDLLGAAIAIIGDTIVTGAPGERALGLYTGAAYVFERDLGGPGNWGEATKLTASDPAEGQYFGAAVAVSGDTTAIGAYGDQALGLYTGAAYVFERDLGGAENWGQVKKLAASDQTAFDRFGSAIGISGDAIVVGRYGDDDLGHRSGSAYLFERDLGGGDNWGEAKKLTASDADDGDEFGWSVAVDADRAVAGAHLDEDAAFEAGSEYHFERNQGGPGSWGEIEKLTASDATESDEFGGAVAVSGDTLVVAAVEDADEGLGTGSVYIYAPPVNEEVPPLRVPTMSIWGLSLLGATLLFAGTSRL